MYASAREDGPTWHYHRYRTATSRHHHLLSRGPTYKFPVALLHNRRVLGKTGMDDAGARGDAGGMDLWGVAWILVATYKYFILGE